jgi:hypothetical protein
MTEFMQTLFITRGKLIVEQTSTPVESGVTHPLK